MIDAPLPFKVERVFRVNVQSLKLVRTRLPRSSDLTDDEIHASIQFTGLDVGRGGRLVGKKRGFGW